MTASSSTTHYQLSQYADNDRPSYTGDYNSDMAKIDAAIYAASQTGGGTGGLETVAVTSPLSGNGTAGSPITVDLSSKADRTAQPPEMLGLTAKQLDSLYVDESGIIRVPLS